MKAISNPVIVFDGGSENHTTEGPKLYKRDGWYWILCPAGGVEQGWQLAMRSRNPYGPYEWKRVLQRGRSGVNGPHQGGWVHTAQGEDWFVHFQDRGAYGRVVWLQPVDWSSGWPVMGKGGEPYTTYRKPKSSSTLVMNPQESDEFNSYELGKQWQWQADYDQCFGMPTADGHFRLFTFRQPRLDGEANLWNVPNLLLQKTPAEHFVATAKVRLAAKNDRQSGGIIMMGRGYSALVVTRRGDGFVLRQLTCDKAEEGEAERATDLASLKPTARDTIPYHPALYRDLYLQMRVADGVVRFAYSTDGRRYQPVGAPFTMRPGKWIGAKMGLVAVEGNAVGDLGLLDIDWFRITREGNGL